MVQIIQKGENIPFDVSAMRTIPIDHHDLDNVAEAKKEMKNQIDDAIVKKPDEIESPISVSLDLKSLRQSEKPEGRSLAEIISVVMEIRSEIYNIKRDLKIAYDGKTVGHLVEFERRYLLKNVEMVKKVIYQLEHFEKELSYEKEIHSIYFAEISNMKKTLHDLQKRMQSVFFN